jgi:hypothetical protein
MVPRLRLIIDRQQLGSVCDGSNVHRRDRQSLHVAVSDVFHYPSRPREHFLVAGPVIKEKWDSPATQLGFALSAFGVCYALLQIVNGYLGDRFGPREIASILESSGRSGRLRRLSAAGSTHSSRRAYSSVWVRPAPSQPLHVR